MSKHHCLEEQTVGGLLEKLAVDLGSLIPVTGVFFWNISRVKKTPLGNRLLVCLFSEVYKQTTPSCSKELKITEEINSLVGKLQSFVSEKSTCLWVADRGSLRPCFPYDPRVQWNTCLSYNQTLSISPPQEILSTASSRQDTSRELHNSKHIPSSNTQISRVTQDSSKDTVRKASLTGQGFAALHPDSSIRTLKDAVDYFLD